MKLPKNGGKWLIYGKIVVTSAKNMATTPRLQHKRHTTRDPPHPIGTGGLSTHRHMNALKYHAVRTCNATENHSHVQVSAEIYFSSAVYSSVAR